MAPRGQRRPGEYIPRPRRKVRKSKKSGACSMSLPAAAARTTMVLAQLVAVEWQIRGARSVTYLIHFSAHEGLPLGVISRRQNIEGATKPEGLWLSVEGNGDGWSDWCHSEKFRLGQLAVAHRVTLAEDANVLYLSTPEQLDEFTLTYSLTDSSYWRTPERLGYRIDWRTVAAKHQGIIITPYMWQRRLTLHTHWYYGWDCASGCIWDRTAVAAVEVVPSVDCLAGAS